MINVYSVDGDIRDESNFLYMLDIFTDRNLVASNAYNLLTSQIVLSLNSYYLHGVRSNINKQVINVSAIYQLSENELTRIYLELLAFEETETMTTIRRELNGIRARDIHGVLPTNYDIYDVIITILCEVVSILVGRIVNDVIYSGVLNKGNEVLSITSFGIIEDGLGHEYQLVFVAS